MPFRAFGDSDLAALPTTIAGPSGFNALSGIRGF